MSTEKKESTEWLKAIIIALVLTFLIRQFLFAPVIVDGESMMPTLESRDRMIVNKISTIFGTPDRFDIIVFHAPGGKDYIKRVIGLPGDSIEYQDDTLYVNGEKIDEPYLNALKQLSEDNHENPQDFPDYFIHMYEGSTVTGDFRIDSVPDGTLFVLGDNRRGSRDSRDIGPVPIDEVIGKANVVFWPLSNIRIAK